MNFESLPNELLLDIFNYIPAVQLLRSFTGLNSRFDKLLFNFYQTYHLDFQNLSPIDINTLHQQYIPLIVERIRSLRLFDGDTYCPTQIAQLFSSGIRFQDFIELRALSLYNIDSNDTMANVMTECCHLPSLTHMKIVECNITFEMTNNEYNCSIMSTLSKLTNLCLLSKTNFIPTRDLPMLKHLSVQMYRYRLNELNQLLQRIPNIKSLCLVLDTFVNDQYLTIQVPSLISLKLRDIRSRSTVRKLLEVTPNLNRLIVETVCVEMNGDQWKDIISNCLLKLKIFRLKSRIEYHKNENNKQIVDNLLNTFRSAFWLETHRWFIRCHRKSMDEFDNILLYTYPQTLDEFDMHAVNISYESTYPNDNNFVSHLDTERLNYNSTILLPIIFPYVHFSIIRHLSVELPVNASFLTVVKDLNRLTSLSISSTHHDAGKYLQDILDRTPYLKSLTISSWPLSQIPLINNRCPSIRQIDLNSRTHYLLNIKSFVKTNHYDTFATSPLGTQCELLSIATNSVNDIVCLVTKMSNIRILDATCKADKWRFDDDVTAPERNQILDTLKSFLPVGATIQRFAGLYGYIRISIPRQIIKIKTIKQTH